MERGGAAQGDPSAPQSWVLAVAEVSILIAEPSRVDVAASITAGFFASRTVAPVGAFSYRFTRLRREVS